VIRGTGVNVNVTEGFQVSGTVATFTDTNPTASPTNVRARIHWGDGTTTNGTVSGNTGGPFTVSGTHLYLDEGDYNTRVTLLPNAPSTAVGTAKGLAQVAEDDTFTGSSGFPIIATAGSRFSGPLALFTDVRTPGRRELGGDFTTLFIWDDGTRTSGTASDAGGVMTVNGHHTWAKSGNYLVKIVVADDGSGLALDVATTTATVKAAPTRSMHRH
jgi:hypothetical protein